MNQMFSKPFSENHRANNMSESSKQANNQAFSENPASAEAHGNAVSHSDESDNLRNDWSNNFDVNQLITHQQAFNEGLIKLCVLLYQVDGIVTLTEQDYFEELCNTLEWRSGIALPAFVNNAIHEARVAIDSQQTREFLFALAPALNTDPARALEVAMDITEVDGVRSDEEIELLSLLSNRVLAKGLVA